MTIVGCCRPVRDGRELAEERERCSRSIPCLSDPGRRSNFFFKVALAVLHVIFVGVLFLFDRGLREKTLREPWYTAIYLLLLVGTLVQYFITSATSPGYVIDAMRAWNETQLTFSKTSKTSEQQPASSKIGSFISLMDGRQEGRNIYEMKRTSWVMQVMNMYPPGSSSRHLACTHCNLVQPPRAKHCHDCGKCVLQFDHHCVWLGTCIGQGNHCRFWWFLFEDTALCIWTSILFILFLKANTARQWWQDAVVIMLLIILGLSLIFLLSLLLFHSYLMLTNQKTYEFLRRRRIPYLRSVPERVYPFSRGMCRNVYDFCRPRRSILAMERLPTAEELESRARPYGCMDIVSCRCC